MKPLAIDLFCGLGGWAEGFLAEGFDVVGFDTGHTAPYAAGARYPGQLVIQDVLTLHGSQFRNAACIVASPPCQNYSYLAMPWSRSPDFVRPQGDGWEVLNSAAAKEMREKWEREGPDNRLFDACFRIQREACEAAGRYIPLIVENVRGAIPWVGRSAWNYGSFHLWGDVPALMPINLGRGHIKVPNVQTWSDYGKPGYKATAFNGQAQRNLIDEGQKVPGFRFDGSGRSFQSASVESTGKKGLERAEDRTGEVPDGTGNSSWFFKGNRRDPRDIRQNENGDWVALDGTKIGGDWFRDPACHSRHGSRSNARRMASAQIAKIPLPLAQHIAHVYKPRSEAAA